MIRRAVIAMIVMIAMIAITFAFAVIAITFVITGIVMLAVLEVAARAAGRQQLMGEARGGWQVRSEGRRQAPLFIGYVTSATVSS